MNLPRALDVVEIRVLGCLLEKQQITPEYYPLTVNALVAACNQRSSREPVMDLGEAEVTGALDRLAEHVLVWRSAGSRTDRWAHSLDRRLELDPPAKAILTLLFLRGPQTPGELRGRAERMHTFATTAEVDAVLHRLAAGAEPLVVELPRQPGHKESRWAHLAAGPPQMETPSSSAPAAALAVAGRAGDLALRVAALEERVEALAEELRSLIARLGD